MISFDYSFKKIKFGDAKNGSYFTFDDKEEGLFIKIEEVQIYTRFNLSDEDLSRRPRYNAYSLTARRFLNVSLTTEVIPCEIAITVKPQV